MGLYNLEVLPKMDIKKAKGIALKNKPLRKIVLKYFKYISYIVLLKHNIY